MSNVITTRVSDEVLTMIDQLAVSRERSRAWVLARLVEAAAMKEIEFDEILQAGLDDVASGRTTAHEVVFARMRARRSERKAA